MSVLRHPHPLFPPLRLRHPGLFLVATASGLTNLFIGLGFSLGPPAWRSSTSFIEIARVAPLRLWGVGFALVGAGLLIGVFRKSFSLARGFLYLGCALSTFWAVALILGALSGELTGASGPPLFSFFAACQFAEAIEPAINPASAVPPRAR